MTCTDPTGGAGYATGERLPSTHMTTIATQQPRILDIIDGGNFANLQNVTLSAGSAFIRHFIFEGMKVYIQADAQLDSSLIINNGSGGQITYGTPTQLRRQQPLSAWDISTNSGGDDWIRDPAIRGALKLDWVNSGGSTQAEAWIECNNIANGLPIANFGAVVNDPNTGAEATVKPDLSLYRVDLSGSSPTLTQIGSTLSFSSYRNGTTEQTASVSHTVSAVDNRYLMRIRGEASTNAATGLRIYQPFIEFTIADLRMV